MLMARNEEKYEIFFKGRKKKGPPRGSLETIVFPSVTRSQSGDSEKDTKLKAGGGKEELTELGVS